MLHAVTCGVQATRSSENTLWLTRAASCASPRTESRPPPAPPGSVRPSHWTTQSRGFWGQRATCSRNPEWYDAKAPGSAPKRRRASSPLARVQGLVQHAEVAACQVRAHAPQHRRAPARLLRPPLPPFEPHTSPHSGAALRSSSPTGSWAALFLAAFLGRWAWAWAWAWASSLRLFRLFFPFCPSTSTACPPLSWPWPSKPTLARFRPSDPSSAAEGTEGGSRCEATPARRRFAFTEGAFKEGTTAFAGEEPARS